MKLSDRMQAFLDRRHRNKAYRTLVNYHHLIDFSSNDYLGIARNKELQERIHQSSQVLKTGATGSRLLSGHFDLLTQLETKICEFHQGEAALVFNSGYNANLALMATLPRKSDVILYDELVHASIHDGIKMGNAPAVAFAHNDLAALEALLETHQDKVVFVIVESIYSMDGNQAKLSEIAKLCTQYQANLIVDEAHSTGICGSKGEGLCVELGIQNQVFARLHTFGKAIGTHGAAVVGSHLLREYLINFARPLIYTTAMTPHTTLATLSVYDLLERKGGQLILELKQKIHYFKQMLHQKKGLQTIESNSPIQSIIISGNEAVTRKAEQLQKLGFDARPIRTPTVPAGKERIRICLHHYNTTSEIEALLSNF